MRKITQIGVMIAAVMLAGCSGMGFMQGSSSSMTTPGGTNYQSSPTNNIPLSG